MADTPEAVRKSIRTYLFVGAVLFAGTIATVLVATVPWLDVGHHGFDTMDAILGLAIAATKASLVAAVFMHLNHEKKAVYWIFGSGIVFVIALFALTALAKSDPILDPYFNDGAAGANSPTLANPGSNG
jgi:caa(3)-type oxidase subunit IV